MVEAKADIMILCAHVDRWAALCKIIIQYLTCIQSSISITVDSTVQHSNSILQYTKRYVYSISLYSIQYVQIQKTDSMQYTQVQAYIGS